MKLILLFVLICQCLAWGRHGGYRLKVSTQKTSIPSNCKNAFLASLKSDKVHIYDRPQSMRYSSQTCKAEWSKYKTCCEIDSLVKSFKTDDENAKKVNGQLEEVVKNINAAVEKILGVQEPQSAKKKETAARVASFKALKEAKNAEMSSTTSDSEHPAEDSLASTNAKLPPGLVKKTNKELMNQALNNVVNSKIHETFPVASEKCLDQMSKVRGSSLCSICSGRGEVFFHRGKPLIELSVCESVVNSCSDFFNQVRAFLIDYRTLVTISQTEITDAATRNTLTQLDKDLKKFSPPTDLLRNFKLHDSTKNETVKRTQATAICGKILNVREQTYFDKISQILKDESQVAKADNNHHKVFWVHFQNGSFDKGFSKNGVRMWNSRGGNGMHFGGFRPNWGRGFFGRRLTTTSPSTNLASDNAASVFNSDSTVIMKQSDNMFDSYDGAKGTSLGVLTPCAQTITKIEPFP